MKEKSPGKLSPNALEGSKVKLIARVPCGI